MKLTHLKETEKLTQCYRRRPVTLRRAKQLIRAACLACLLGANAGSSLLLAQTAIPIPNGSFELPVVGEPLFAGPEIDSWQKTAEPAGYDTNVFGPWDEKCGVFFNVPFPQAIDNVDGSQAAFLFNFPGVGFFQDYDSISGTNSMPSNEFDASFEVGKSYRLTAGFTTSTSFFLAEGSTLKMIFHFRDGASNRVTVAETTVTYSTNVFTDPFHLLDYHVNVPIVDSGDAWAGKNIGVELVSTTDISMITGGIWDLDHVRLIEFVSPTLTAPARTGNQFEFTLLSDPGAPVEVLTSSDASLALSNWTSLGTLTNFSGTTNFQDAGAAGEQRFYAARQLP